MTSKLHSATEFQWMYWVVFHHRLLIKQNVAWTIFAWIKVCKLYLDFIKITWNIKCKSRHCPGLWNYVTRLILGHGNKIASKDRTIFQIRFVNQHQKDPDHLCFLERYLGSASIAENHVWIKSVFLPCCVYTLWHSCLCPAGITGWWSWPNNIFGYAGSGLSLRGDFHLDWGSQMEML